MPAFCASCGEATGGGRFCPKCGSPQPGGAAAYSSSQTPYVPPRKKSHVLTIVLIALALLVVLGIAGIVKGYYFIKDRVEDAKQELAKSKVSSPQRTQAGCDLISKKKVAEILGTTVASIKGNEAGDLTEYCNYYSQAAAASDTDKSDGDDEKGAASKDSQPGLKDLESLAKKISEAAKNRPLLSAQIYRGNAAAALIGIKTISRIAGGNESSVPGPWDEAYFGPKDAIFVVRKGDNGFLLNLGRVERKREAALQIAKVMVAGL